MIVCPKKVISTAVNITPKQIKDMIQASVATYVSSSLTAITMGISGKFFFVLLHTPPGASNHTTIVEQGRDNPQPYTEGQQTVDYGGQQIVRLWRSEPVNLWDRVYHLSN